MDSFRIIGQTGHDNPSPEPTSIDLTIVVPTSNTALYLDTCLNSITVQDGLSLELIVIDYKSTDNTLQIVRAFAQAHPTIPVTIVDQINPGLGDARNYGIQIAKGEFIAFLDSDDFFAPNVYAEMVGFARQNVCDLVFCRGVVFDHETKSTHVFYDDWIWEQMTAEKSCRVTTVEAEPRLLQLEPNANIRISRLSFIRERDIFYPENRRCEDVVPHYMGLFEARRIGLVSSRGYFYRIGRAGKLTSNPSKWVLDGLDAMALAVGLSRTYQPSPRAGAAMIYLFQRFVFGYGRALPFDQRKTYYQRASLLFVQMPKDWVTIALNDVLKNHVRDAIALLALVRQDIKFLIFWSCGPKNEWTVALRLFARPAYWKFARRYLSQQPNTSDVKRNQLHENRERFE